MKLCISVVIPPRSQHSMINPREGQVDAAATIASAHNRPGNDTAESWFVPPIVVPAFLMILIVARAFYSAFS